MLTDGAFCTFLVAHNLRKVTSEKSRLTKGISVVYFILVVLQGRCDWQHW